MKILFSPVGMTDPMTEDKIAHQGYYDGALLHICRHEKPDIVYLYMSKETLDVSSGTPAMKSALQILAAANDIELQPRQVSTPSRAANNIFNLSRTMLTFLSVRNGWCNTTA